MRYIYEAMVTSTSTPGSREMDVCEGTVMSNSKQIQDKDIRSASQFRWTNGGQSIACES
jgi:hypothetical protein